MPKPFLQEFRDDVVNVARIREPGQHLKQIAADFGISESCLTNWMKAADVEGGVKPETPAAENADLREAASGFGCWSRRTKSCAGPPPPKLTDLPARPRTRRRRRPRRGDVPGLKIARQPYYRWLTAPVTTSELVHAYRAGALFDAHRDDPEFGYRSLVDEATASGQPMAARTAWAICAANRWWSAFGKPRRGKGGRPGPPVHDDQVNRDFTAAAPNQLWLTDITEHRTAAGKRYLCAVKDAHSNRIVGYSIADRMESRLAVTAIDDAVARRAADGAEVAGCIVHSDRGSHSRSRKFVYALGRHQLSGSIGRVGAAGDNAAMESQPPLGWHQIRGRSRSRSATVGPCPSA